MSYIRKDRLVSVPIEGGELLLSAAYDTLHHFTPLGAYILKYWDQEGATMCNVMMSDASATHLMGSCDLSVVERPFIMETENRALMQWQADQLTDEQYGL